MRRRKNFLPPLILALIFLAISGYIVYYLPPSSFTIVSFFLFSFFFFLFLTFSLLLANSRRGFLISAGITIFLLLRFFKIANLLTLGLLLSTLFLLEIYFKR